MPKESGYGYGPDGPLRADLLPGKDDFAQNKERFKIPSGRKAPDPVYSSALYDMITRDYHKRKTWLPYLAFFGAIKAFTGYRPELAELRQLLPKKTQRSRGDPEGVMVFDRPESGLLGQSHSMAEAESAAVWSVRFDAPLAADLVVQQRAAIFRDKSEGPVAARTFAGVLLALERQLENPGVMDLFAKDPAGRWAPSTQGGEKPLLGIGGSYGEGTAEKGNARAASPTTAQPNAEEEADLPLYAPTALREQLLWLVRCARNRVVPKGDNIDAANARRFAWPLFLKANFMPFLKDIAERTLVWMEGTVAWSTQGPVHLGRDI